MSFWKKPVPGINAGVVEEVRELRQSLEALTRYLKLEKHTITSKEHIEYRPIPVHGLGGILEYFSGDSNAGGTAIRQPNVFSGISTRKPRTKKRKAAIRSKRSARNL